MQVILAESAGFCYGVKRAVELAQKTAEETQGCWMLGDLIHNTHVVNDLAARGVRKTSIGDDGEVIAEESTAVYSGKVQRNTGSGLLRDGQRNRRDGNQSTGGCANGSGDQSGNDKDARENEMNGENAQAQVHNAGNTAHTLA